MKACYYLGEAKDTISIPYLLKKIDDPRISHHINFKGMSVYQAKITALRKITEQNFGQINYQPDSLIIKKWEKWWQENKTD